MGLKGESQLGKSVAIPGLSDCIGGLNVNTYDETSEEPSARQLLVLIYKDLMQQQLHSMRHRLLLTILQGSDIEDISYYGPPRAAE